MSRILVVDDDRNIRQLYRLELEEAGHEVLTAGDGYKLLDRLERQRPDLIVLDSQLSGENGSTLLKAIRKKFVHLPIILCSGHDFCKETVASMGADYGVLKSSDLTLLKEVIGKALAGTLDRG